MEAESKEKKYFLLFVFLKWLCDSLSNVRGNNYHDGDHMCVG